MGFGKDGKGVIINEFRTQSIGTLATNTGIIIDTKLATLERFRMLKAQIYALVTGVTSGELRGLQFGLADGQFTLAQIEEAMEANGPLGPNNDVTADQVERPVWVIGQVENADDTEIAFMNDEGGNMLVIKPRWTFARAKSWNWFVYNLGVAPTSGAVVKIRVKSFGVWVT